ncbi:MAG: HAD hydrolase-like protein [Nanohaloarchaea archaeon]|nr:HAD hydrolase-like protein [Candidatus Nanohaloarchaea archaeon]
MAQKSAYELKGTPQLIIADGAGTLFDPKSIVPAYAFERTFLEEGIDTDIPTICLYMGMEKIKHIELLLKKSAVLEQFKEKYERTPDKEDIDRFYSIFQNQLYPSAEETEEIEGVKEAAYRLKDAGIPLIMTTGYDRKMVDKTRKKLPWLDEVLTASFTSSDVEQGRPAPDMICLAMNEAGIETPAYAVKVGDTKVDVEASDNASMPGIIVLSGSIETRDDAEKTNAEIGREHLILPSFIDVVNYTIDGTLPDKIKKLNN